MEYEEFIGQILKDVGVYFAGEMEVQPERVRKENGVMLDGISVHSKDAKASPVVYLDVFYDAYKEGESIDVLEDILIRTFEHYTKEIPFDPEKLSDPDYVRPRLVCRVVNTEKNRDLLSAIPHRDFLDLSVVYYILMEDLRTGVGGVKVSNDLMESWGMTAEELDSLARANTSDLMPWEIHPLQLPQDERDAEPFAPRPIMYVLSNNVQTLGGFWITEEEVLFRCAETIGGSCYILPSSIHECLLVPEWYVDHPETLSMMVRDINEAALDPKEVLSDHAYYCDLQHRAVRVAGE